MSRSEPRLGAGAAATSQRRWRQDAAARRRDGPPSARRHTRSSPGGSSSRRLDASFDDTSDARWLARSQFRCALYTSPSPPAAISVMPSKSPSSWRLERRVLVRSAISFTRRASAADSLPSAETRAFGEVRSLHEGSESATEPRRERYGEAESRFENARTRSRSEPEMPPDDGGASGETRTRLPPSAVDVVAAAADSFRASVLPIDDAQRERGGWAPPRRRAGRAAGAVHASGRWRARRSAQPRASRAVDGPRSPSAARRACRAPPATTCWSSAQRYRHRRRRQVWAVVRARARPGADE